MKRNSIAPGYNLEELLERGLTEQDPNLSLQEVARMRLLQAENTQKIVDGKISEADVPMKKD